MYVCMYMYAMSLLQSYMKLDLYKFIENCNSFLTYKNILLVLANVDNFSTLIRIADEIVLNFFSKRVLVKRRR